MDIKEIINYFKGFDEGDNITITCDFLDNIEILIEIVEDYERLKGEDYENN